MANKWWSYQLSISLCLLLVSNVLDSAVACSLVDNDGSSPIERHLAVKLDPTIEYLGPQKTLTVWQIPPGPVKRVLFMAIGRHSYPWDYWDRTPSCPMCTGLPEYRKIVLDALGYSYAVILISPIEGGEMHAWPPESPDLINAASILESWKRTHGLENTSVVAHGTSSGGHAVSTLALKHPPLFESMVLMMSWGSPEAWQQALTKPHFPPTLFVYCPRDWQTASDVVRIMITLHKKGWQTNEIQVVEHPITPTWFSELIPGLDPLTARAIYDAFKEDGSILDEQDYLLSYHTDWQSVLRARNILPEDPDIPGQLLHECAIYQEMRLAFALHMTTSRKDEEMFRWLDGDYDISAPKPSSSFERGRFITLSNKNNDNSGAEIPRSAGGLRTNISSTQQSGPLWSRGCS